MKRLLNNCCSSATTQKHLLSTIRLREYTTFSAIPLIIGGGKKTRRQVTPTPMLMKHSFHINKYVQTLSNNNSNNGGSRGHKSIEHIYQKKTPVQHVLERPDTYVGSIERLIKPSFILQQRDQHHVQIVNKQIAYPPALYKIVDELLVNAVDNHNRAKTGTDELRVSINEDWDKAHHNNFWIHVWNNGKSVPVQIHKKEKIYVPELVFGHLLTGSNFDDTEAKYTGGRNGYGAKLANIFSNQFVVEIADPMHQALYRQVWSHNMGQCEQPEIKTIEKSRKTSDGYIKVSIQPDLSKFSEFENSEQLSDFIALLKRRVYDLAACNPGLKVFLNEERVPVSGFQDYIKLFYQASDQTEDSVVYKKINNNLELAIGPSMSLLDNPNGKNRSQIQEINEFTHFSFVNSIATSNGGTHISHIANTLARKILEHIKKHPLFKEHEFKTTAKSASNDNQFLKIILSQISVFANCMVENPTFDSQTKETLTTKTTQLMGKHFQIHAGAENEKKLDDLVKQLVAKTNLLDEVLSIALFRQERKMKSKSSKSGNQGSGKLMIPKLDDANLAGGPESYKCTLILTEGDSAKALAVAGLSVVGRDTFGIFPLKGKLLNVRDATSEQISKNAEIANLKKILGLENYIDSEDTDARSMGLRYGRVMLMCDQDHDGSHIKGLFLNFMHYFYPNLMRSGFVEQFITPIIKVFNKKDVLAFFSVAEFEKWKTEMVSAHGNQELNKWRIKYYKGLGTSTSSEAKEYFSKLDEKHRITFSFAQQKKTDDELVEMIFSKTNAQQRKDWLSKYTLLSESEGDQFVDHSTGKVSLTDFFNKEFIHFSQYDNVRSIPSLVDGLKPSQRKVLYAIMNKRKNASQNEVKVAQLAGYVSEITAYHHGEASLNSTIVNMAQDFVGSGNNIPLLYPSGQFGTRLQGGKDAASARYIFTRLNGLTRYIFPEADDAILDYNEEDGMTIEPKFFVPVIPMILVNGAEGMGTGWSTSIPTFHPLDIIKNLRSMLQHNNPSGLNIWTRGFKGEIEFEADKKRYVSYGVIQLLPMGKRDKDFVVRISELPIGRWTEDYKNHLLSLVSDVNGLVKKFSEHHTDVHVQFDLTLRSEVVPETSQKIQELIDCKAMHKLLRLESYISVNNLTLFDSQGHIAQYDSAVDILTSFYSVRLEYYGKRKSQKLSEYQADLKLLGNKLKFLRHFTSNNKATSSSSNPLVRFAQKKREEMVDYLRDEIGLEPINDSFQYVLNLPLWNLTEENVDKLQKQFDDKQQYRDILAQKTPEQLWLEDLDELEGALTRAKENYVV